jgi:YHS domain-containing protein
MRAIQLLTWAILLAVILLPLLRRRPAAPRRSVPVQDELVKDPVCQTYVVRSRAVRPSASAGAPYFCSVECARRYAAGARH